MTTHVDADIDEFQVLTYGAKLATVCTSLSVGETTDRLNDVHPTGIVYDCKLRWQLAVDNVFPDGQDNPHRCELRPETHVHRLYTC